MANGRFFGFLLKRQQTTPEFLDNESVSPTTPIQTDERVIAQEVIRREVKKHFSTKVVADENDFRRSLGALIGIAQGLLCDDKLSDQEIQYLNGCLADNDAIS